MDKKEILESNVSLYFSSDHGGESDGAEWHTTNTPAEKIYSSMDEYAKQQCLAFAQFLVDGDYRPFDKMGKDHWLQGGMSISTPASELYNKFLTETSI